MAEREGFEPSVPLLAAHTISSRAPSASSDISPRTLRELLHARQLHRFLQLKFGVIMLLKEMFNRYVEKLIGAKIIFKVDDIAVLL